MAQIVINYDSETKEISATLGGTALDSSFMDYISFAKHTDYENGGKEWCCCINMSAKSEDGVKSYVQICASETPKLEGAGIKVTQEKPCHANLAKAYAERKNGSNHTN